MSARALALLFAIALLAMLVATVPLRWAITRMNPEPLGLSATSATGSIWHGRLHDVRLRGVALGDVDTGLSPWSLLVGVRRLAFDGASLRATLLQGRRVGLQDASGRLRFLSPALLPGTALTVASTDATLLFDQDGCRIAKGRMTVEVRPATTADDAPPLLTLAGDLTCEDGLGSVALKASPGAGATGDITVNVKIAADGEYRLQSAARGVDARTALVLEAAGFQRGPGGLSRADRGRLNP